MVENHFWKTLRNIFAKAGATDGPKPIEQPFVAPALFLKDITFSDGTQLALKRNSIIVVTGPNNSGKSTVLQTIERTLSDGRFPNPVVKDLSFEVQGTAQQFRDFIEGQCLKGDTEGTVLAGGPYSRYSLSGVEEDMRTAFRGKSVSGLFFSRQNAAARLDSVRPIRRMDWTSMSPNEPLQWLDFEIDAENDISAAFKKVFGLSLIVNRTAGENLMLHVSDRNPPEFDNYKRYRDWLSSLPQLQKQGDGMKSFAAMLLGIKIHPKSLILLDEPEAFLHHPQARRLAEIITNDTNPDTQIWLATHSDEIVRGLLDSSHDRVTVVRLDREANVTSARILEAERVKVLWTDPLLRTSDVLSALFHEVAIICEGETDVRFFRALIDANRPEERLPDFKLYHVGGKDKFVSIVTALRALNLPTCVICDLDILSEPDKFSSLYSALGGDRGGIEKDIEQISRHVAQRNALVTGQEAARKLRAVADDLEREPKVSNSVRQRISAVVRDASAWSRLKVDGYRGLESATIVQAFERVYQQSKSIGLLMNREGELEGLCREATITPKSKWLNEVLTRDLARDASLADARKMLNELEDCIRTIRRGMVGSGG